MRALFRLWADRRSLRPFAAFAIVFAVSACSQFETPEEQKSRVWQAAGWHYVFEAGDDRGAAVYRFPKQKDAYFIALCGGQSETPTFAVHHRGYDFLTRSFTVEIDGKSWTFPNQPDVETNSLHLDDPRMGARFANARRHIVYRVGANWLVEIPPSPVLKRLVDECRRRNLGEAR